MLLLLCALVTAPGVLPAQVEAALGQQLAAAGTDMMPGSRIALAPPPPDRSPVPVPEIEAIMTRAAQVMAADWPVKPRILAGSAGLRASLAVVRARQGAQAWQDTVNATLRQEADYVLVGETGLRGGTVTLRLSLVALEDGRVLAQTSDVALTASGGAVAATPRGAIGAAVRQMLDIVPEARAEVTVGPFVNEPSGLETAAGRAMADIAVEAWLEAANSVTALLRDAPPARVARGSGPGPGFFLEGTIRPVDADRFQLVLRLWQDGALRVNRILDLSTLPLAPQLRATLAPERMRAGPVFDPLRDLVQGLGAGQLTLQTLGGVEGRYPVCRATDPQILLQVCADSLIRLVLRADVAGEVLCLSIDEAATLSLILPNAYAPAPRLVPGQALTLPDALPPLPGGGQIVWPAMGPPSQTLIGCLLYPRLPATVIDAISRLDGTRLSVEEARQLRALLRDAGPLASAGALVSTVD